MADPTTKAELLAMMQHGQHAFEALLAPLNERQMTMPGVCGDWSIKDILVHLATWQGRVTQILEAVPRGKQPHLDPVIKTDEEMHRFNDATCLAQRSRSLVEVQRDFRAAYHKLFVSVEALREEDLFAPERFAWKGQALWKMAEGDTYGHYADHVPVIEAWLASQHG